MITATELRTKNTTRPRLRMYDVVSFCEDIQEDLLDVAACNKTCQTFSSLVRRKNLIV